MNKYTAQTYKNINNTIYVYNLDEKVTDEILFELFLQCGPVKYVFLPNDRLTKVHLGYAFIEFNKAEDAEYAINIMSNIKLYNRPLRITKAAEDKNSFLTGANLFVRNVGDDVNEKSLQALFSHYGTVLSVQIMRDATTGKSRGYAFVNFDSIYDLFKDYAANSEFGTVDELADDVMIFGDLYTNIISDKKKNIIYFY